MCISLHESRPGLTAYMEAPSPKLPPLSLLHYHRRGYHSIYTRSPCCSLFSEYIHRLSVKTRRVRSLWYYSYAPLAARAKREFVPSTRLCFFLFFFLDAFLVGLSPAQPFGRRFPCRLLRLLRQFCSVTPFRPPSLCFEQRSRYKV